MSTVGAAHQRQIQISKPLTAAGPGANAVERNLLSALEALKNYQAAGKRGTPPPMVARDMRYVAQAIAEVYAQHGADPQAAARISKAVTAQVVNGLVNQRVMDDGDRTGSALAKKYVDLAKADGVSRAADPRVPTDPMDNVWSAVNEAGEPISPLLPSFGKLSAVIEANRTARAAAPTFNDGDWRDFFAGYARRTPEQIASAKYWADGPGTVTPPGHWNIIATAASQSVGLSVNETAKMMKTLNEALSDAAVACWDTKFKYATERPFQAAKRLGIPFKSLLATPPFPGYPSGHAMFSGAAAQVLGRSLEGLSAGKTDSLRRSVMGFAQTEVTRQRVRQAGTPVEMFQALATEAADSRIFGGIHIEADGVNGLAAGRRIGENFFNSGLRP